MESLPPQLRLAVNICRLLLTLVYLSYQTLWAFLSLATQITGPLIKSSIKALIRSLRMPLPIPTLDPLLPTHVNSMPYGELETIIR
ncbi:putative transmembrane protein [Lasius niger virus 1]|uniref:Putative transmembrane protein n=1 Tax=Lasius niger virus 1 TaxID=2018503 RepID=A0A220QTF7_9VIRU|nr:putative transmembrane protein [Lasius niger virus 1]ASK12208.1 putative transmembrane protein [Lasius niger virus 1]